MAILLQIKGRCGLLGGAGGSGKTFGRRWPRMATGIDTGLYPGTKMDKLSLDD